MQITPTYYVSGVQAKGTTGTLNGLTVYPFSDLDLFSTDVSPVKTVATGDCVGWLDDASYALVKNCTPPIGAILIGARNADGSIDLTRAYRTACSCASAYRFLFSNAGVALANLDLSNAQSGQAMVGGTGTSCSVLNCVLSCMPTAASTYAIASGANNWVAWACRITAGATTPAGIAFDGGSSNHGGAILHCFVDGGAIGISSGKNGLHTAHCVVKGAVIGFQQGRSDGMMAHCTADDCSSDGFAASSSALWTRASMVGNLAAHCGGDAYDINVASVNGRAFLNNAYHTITGSARAGTTPFVLYQAPINQAALTYAGGSPYDYTPAETTLPDAGVWIYGTGAGRNLAGALTAATSGGGGGGRGGIAGPVGGAISNWSRVGG